MNPITIQDIIEAGRQASLTSTVLAECAEKGTRNNANTCTGYRLANTTPGSNHAASGC